MYFEARNNFKLIYNSHDETFLFFAGNLLDLFFSFFKSLRISYNASSLSIDLYIYFIFSSKSTVFDFTDFFYLFPVLFTVKLSFFEISACFIKSGIDLSNISSVSKL